MLRRLVGGNSSGPAARQTAHALRLHGKHRSSILAPRMLATHTRLLRGSCPRRLVLVRELRGVLDTHHAVSRRLLSGLYDGFLLVDYEWLIQQLRFQEAARDHVEQLGRN